MIQQLMVFGILYIVSVIMIYGSILIIASLLRIDDKKPSQPDTTNDKVRKILPEG